MIKDEMMDEAKMHEVSEALDEAEGKLIDAVTETAIARGEITTVAMQGHPVYGPTMTVGLEGYGAGVLLKLKEGDKVAIVEADYLDSVRPLLQGVTTAAEKVATTFPANERLEAKHKLILRLRAMKAGSAIDDGTEVWLRALDQPIGHEWHNAWGRQVGHERFLELQDGITIYREVKDSE